MQRLPINDVNLRLILSKGHEDWFKREIRDRWLAIAVLLVISITSLVSASIWYLMKDDDMQFVYVDETMSAETIKSFEDDGLIIKQKSEAVFESDDDGALTLEKVGQYILIALLFASPFLLMFVGKAFQEIHKLRRWQTEHHEFLAEHGHSPT